ncbi:sugar phosphate isomerase/epimerase family protein [Nocardia sp. NPDC049737]|uniref:sugar phosphate isomerase/epimerase family protein n=1 Tax=Nocardia sp. NPDC049737 TaxID=3154358 RepID=UPI003417AA62
MLTQLAARDGDPGLPVCINPACFRWGTSVSEFLTATRNAGFERVEVSIQQILALAEALGGLDAVATRIADLGVRVEAFSGLIPAGPVLPAPLLVEQAAWSTAEASMDERLTAAAALGCTRAAIVCNPRTDLSPADAVLTAVERLGLLADRAETYGVRLAVEFIGLHAGLPATLDGTHPFVRDLAGLVGLLDQLRHPNVGLLLDTCHLFAAAVPEAEIRVLSPGSVEFVQVSDVPDGIDPAAMRDELRCPPGEGVLDLPGLLAVIADTGYSGPASIELFSPAVWSLDPAEAAHHLFAAGRHGLASTRAYSAGHTPMGGRS